MSPTKKILILSANPKDTARLRLDEEVREIEEGLRRSKYWDQFLIHSKWAVRLRDLRRVMLDEEPQIVHFCGHGEEDGLMVEDDNGNAILVNPDALAGLFELFKDQVKCVLLNACYSQIQAEAISKHINYVIGMNTGIQDKTAIEFAVGFYDALGAGKSIEEAFKFGRNAIQLYNIPEHLIPILKRKPENHVQIDTHNKLTINVTLEIESKIDWGEAPDVSVFFGRERELDVLKKWIINERCRIVTILGIAGIGKTRLSIKLGKGGIGKTDLTLKLAQGIQNEFEYVIWRRLLNAPPVTEILADVTKFLSNQQEIELPDTLDNQISRLLHYLRMYRCLLILDNAEAILQSRQRSGQYREGYEGYGELFKRIGETPHQSCLLVTSREKPREVARLEGKMKPVRSLELGGLKDLDGKKIFMEAGSFSGSDKEWKDLVEFYNGNPLALELAAKHIQEVFFGDISKFLQEGKPVFRDLRELLDWHFERLPNLEKEIMYWLAINREPMSISELREDILSPLAKEQLPSTLQSLQRRIPIEKSETRFTLQPVLIEYMTERLIEQISEEIGKGEFELFNSHALLKALAKDYVRESQGRLILKPLQERLIAIVGDKNSLKSRLTEIISMLREESPLKSGYIAGNVLNLLCEMKTDLRGYDFSHLAIWQAYLQGVNLHDVSFAYSDLSKSVFTQSFGGILSVVFSPDGKLLAAGTANAEIRLWHVETGKQLFIYTRCSKFELRCFQDNFRPIFQRWSGF